MTLGAPEVQTEAEGNRIPILLWRRGLPESDPTLHGPQPLRPPRRGSSATRRSYSASMSIQSLPP